MTRSRAERKGECLPAEELGYPVVSVVLSTYNRCELLERALRSLREQAPGTPTYEIIVVDNNSSDATSAVVAQARQGDGRVRYVFERRQGLSHARNAGIAAARAPLIAFTDDDVRVDRLWISELVRGFARYPDASFIGGRVLPSWPAPPPEWLTPINWAPLALQDRDTDFRADAAYPFPLVGASLAIRREVFERAGLFATEVQRVGDGVGSSEDHDLLLRIWAQGGHGMFVRDAVVTADVQPERMERSYHRRWHRGHGRFAALMSRATPPREERRQVRDVTLFGLPAYFYRRVAGAVGSFLRTWPTGPADRRVQQEGRLLQFSTFIADQARHHRATSGGKSAIGELVRFGGALLRKKLRGAPPAAPAPAHRRRRSDIYAYNGY